MELRSDPGGWLCCNALHAMHLSSSSWPWVVVSDFRFEFVGAEDAGHVNIVHKGNNLPAVRVIRESTGWKVNER